MWIRYTIMLTTIGMGSPGIKQKIHLKPIHIIKVNSRNSSLLFSTEKKTRPPRKRSRATSFKGPMELDMQDTLGKERKGKEGKGRERKRKEGKGKERKGKERNSFIGAPTYQVIWLFTCMKAFARNLEYPMFFVTGYFQLFIGSLVLTFCPQP